MKIEIYDVVRLIDTLGTEKLNPGAIGTVLEQYTNPKMAYEVEFCDSKGFTIELMAFEQKQFVLFVTKENVYKLLFKYFPEVYSEYQKESGFYCDENGIMGHIIFGDLVNKKVLELLRTGQIARIQDYFYFFESMAYSDSEYVQEILVTTVLWRLSSESSLKEYMLKKTATYADALNADIERISNKYPPLCLSPCIHYGVEQMSQGEKRYVAGIDVGSTAIKVTLYDGLRCKSWMEPTGWNPRQGAINILNRASQELGVENSNLSRIFGTGYGRVGLSFLSKAITEHEMLWGGCGVIYFYIRRGDLQNLNFDNCWLILHCT